MCGNQNSLGEAEHWLKICHKMKLGEQSRAIIARLCSPNAMGNSNATNVEPLRGYFDPTHPELTLIYYA